MFGPRNSARAIVRSLKSAPSSAARSTRTPIARTYATKTRTQPPASTPSDGGMGQSLFILAATLTVGGVILSQRGKVTNEASVKAARAKASDGVVRDTKKVEEPIYVKEEESKASVPDIVVKKEEEAEESVQGENAASQGAFNEETGEINWDCPCLGGMADGPCGEDFKAAFSCFVYSEAEPKGVDCVEKFKGMQDCFRLHPEIYGEAELPSTSLPLTKEADRGRD